MRTGGRGKHNFLIGGAFRKAKYEKLRRRKKKRRKRGRAKIPPPNPLPFCPPERSVLVLLREARQSVGILFKMSSDFFQQTPPKLICRLARGFAPRFGWHFGKIIPRIFEINRQFSRRKAAVYKLLSLYCGFAARANGFSFALRESQNEILLNCRCKALPFSKIKNF